MISLTRLDDFNFSAAPLNQWYHPATAIVVYLVLIRVIESKRRHYALSERTLRVISGIQAWHNLCLSLASLFMVVFMMYNIVQHDLQLANGADEDTEFLICPVSPGPHVGRLGYGVYLFYLSKYWELFDTIIQMMKGRRPPSYNFHIWHHTCYLFICFLYMQTRASLSVLAVIINGGVHIIMYYYYYLQSRSKRIWWKHYITRIQIVQFIMGYIFFLTTVKKIYWDLQPCNGKFTLFLHAGFNMTMLVGFVQILVRIKKEDHSQKLAKIN